jgi:hypothetical protein
VELCTNERLGGLLGLFAFVVALRVAFRICASALIVPVAHWRASATAVGGA